MAASRRALPRRRRLVVLQLLKFHGPRDGPRRRRVTLHADVLETSPHDVAHGRGLGASNAAGTSIQPWTRKCSRVWSPWRGIRWP